MDRWGQTGKPPWRVLAVDDEALVGKVVRRCLVTRGLEVVVHTDVRQALQTSPPPDLLVLDLMMPDLDGVAFALRARQQWLDVPIVFVTGGGPPALLARARELGPVLDKPVSCQELADTVLEILAK